MKYQKWTDMDTGEVRWLPSLDGDDEPEPVSPPAQSTVTPGTAQPTQDTGSTAGQLIPVAFERSADPEDVPDAEKLPPPYRGQTGWHNAAPISPVQGLRAFAAVLRRGLNLDEDDR
jgi:hypothetical protein